MLRSLGNTCRGSIALVVLLGTASAVAAQSITDARRVEFTPSADHDAVDSSSGLAIVQGYSLQIFIAGGGTPLQTVNLGKPSPQSDGLIRLDFVALLASPLTGGIVYEAVVLAVGPGGSAASARSNTFSFVPTCAPTISPGSQSLTAGSGTASTTVSAAAGCPWVAISNAPWITVTGGASGTAGGTVTLSVAANTSASSRTGTVTVAGNTFTVNQAGAPCAFTISPSSQTMSAAGGTGTVTVTTSTGCSWTAASGASWVTITSGASRTGSGSVGFTVASNATTQSRSATVTIAGKSFTVTEAAASCSFSVSPVTLTAAPEGVAGGITVTTQSTCAWTVSSGTSWIHVSGSRTGSGTASYTIDPNSASTSRTALVTVAGASVRVNQGGATAPNAPTNLRVVK